MARDKEELEDLNQMIRMFVLFYKTIWNEVNKQFSELPGEDKHKIFGVIAPSIVGMLNTVADDYNTEQSNRKGRNERKGKK
jgi:hypothetical protein